MLYVLDFGIASSGVQPTWVSFQRLDTGAEFAAQDQPVLPVVAASGKCSFTYNWATAPAGVDSIYYKALAGAVEVWDVIFAVPESAQPVGALGSSNVGIPTLPTGVPEASGRLFSDFLLEAVKRRARTPISQATLSTWEALAICDEQTRSYIVPLMLQAGEDYMTARSDQTVAAGTFGYRPPSRAMKLREVQVLNTDGKEVDFARVAIEELPYRTDGFYVLGNEVRLVDPVKWAGFTLRMTYYLRPSRLVSAVDAGVVSTVNRNSGAVGIYAASSNLTGATSVDLVRGTPPFEVSALDVACSVSGTNVTITTAANIPAAWGSAGDLVCLPQQTPAPQIHPDLWNLLVQAVAVDILDGNGDDSAFQRAAARMKKMDTDARLLLTPRVEGEPIPFGGHSPIWDRGWSAR